MKSEQLQEILNAIDPEKLPAETLNDFRREVAAREEREKQVEENERRRREAVPQVVPSWRNVSAGTIVTRSQHWRENNFKPNSTQIGIITDMKILEDDLCVAVFWPIVHWEGEAFASMNHPLNVACQDGRDLPLITMNANQQRKTTE